MEIKIYVGEEFKPIIEDNELYIDMPERYLGQVQMIIKVAEKFNVTLYTCSPTIVKHIRYYTQENKNVKVRCFLNGLEIKNNEIYKVFNYFGKPLYDVEYV